MYKISIFSEDKSILVKRTDELKIDGLAKSAMLNAIYKKVKKAEEKRELLKTICKQQENIRLTGNKVIFSKEYFTNSLKEQVELTKEQIKIFMGDNNFSNECIEFVLKSFNEASNNTKYTISSYWRDMDKYSKTILLKSFEHFPFPMMKFENRDISFDINEFSVYEARGSIKKKDKKS